VAATVVLVRGAWHGAWCWDRVVGQPRAEDMPVEAVDLPRPVEREAPRRPDRRRRGAPRGARRDDAVVCGHAAAGAGAVVEWPTSHSPFLSRRELATALLADRAQAAT